MEKLTKQKIIIVYCFSMSNFKNKKGAVILISHTTPTIFGLSLVFLGTCTPSRVWHPGGLTVPPRRAVATPSQFFYKICHQIVTKNFGVKTILSPNKLQNLVTNLNHESMTPFCDFPLLFC